MHTGRRTGVATVHCSCKFITSSIMWKEMIGYGKRWQKSTLCWKTEVKDVFEQRNSNEAHRWQTERVFERSFARSHTCTIRQKGDAFGVGKYHQCDRSRPSCQNVEAGNRAGYDEIRPVTLKTLKFSLLFVCVKWLSVLEVQRKIDKLSVFQTIFVPMLTYGHESW